MNCIENEINYFEFAGQHAAIILDSTKLSDSSYI